MHPLLLFSEQLLPLLLLLRAGAIPCRHYERQPLLIQMGGGTGGTRKWLNGARPELQLLLLQLLLQLLLLQGLLLLQLLLHGGLLAAGDGGQGTQSAYSKRGKTQPKTWEGNPSGDSALTHSWQVNFLYAVICIHLLWQRHWYRLGQLSQKKKVATQQDKAD